MPVASAAGSEVPEDQQAALTGFARFPVCLDSPFADGYDIAAERTSLADLVTGKNPDKSDPRWSRFIELCDREVELLDLSQRHMPQTGSASLTPQTNPTEPIRIGQLTDAEPDTMTLHTKDAFVLFTGRRADLTGKVASIAGGRRFAAVLKSIWYLSANDNPYADWILIRMYEGLVAVRDRLASVITAREEAIELLKRKGLALSVMGSRSPKSVALGFRSPYGYATAEAIVEFDYYVRMIKTLIYKDRMSDSEGRTAIREVGRQMRALFLEPIRWERHLLREELRPLSRNDFLTGADEPARKRVMAAVALFGEVPRKVFTGAAKPRHTQRRVQLTDLEMRLLKQASLTVADDVEQPNTELL